MMGSGTLRTRYQQERQTLPLHVKAMFEHSLTLMEGELAWVERFLEELAISQVLATDPF